MIWGLVASKANREAVVKDPSVYFNKAQMYIQLAEIIQRYPHDVSYIHFIYLYEIIFQKNMRLCIELYKLFNGIVTSDKTHGKPQHAKIEKNHNVLVLKG